MNYKTLAEAKIGEKAEIYEIIATQSKKRLMELGFTKGSFVYPIIKKGAKGMTAYLVKDSLIALRPCDAAKIKVFTL